MPLPLGDLVEHLGVADLVMEELGVQEQKGQGEQEPRGRREEQDSGEKQTPQAAVASAGTLGPSECLVPEVVARFVPC